jgi:hypothetical protein
MLSYKVPLRTLSVNEICFDLGYWIALGLRILNETYFSIYDEFGWDFYFLIALDFSIVDVMSNDDEQQ